MTIKQSVLQGTVPEGLRIFDAHAHLGEGEYSAAYLFTLPLIETIRLSKKIGIGAMAASSFKALGGNAIAGNVRMMEYCVEHPKDIFAYIFYDPRNSNDILAQIDRYRKHSSFIGVKIHPRDSKSTLVSSAYDPLFEYCQAHDVLILSHTWDTEPENRPSTFGDILRRYPKLRLLIGHMGGTYLGCMDSIALANAYDNVYLDINGSLYSQIWLEELVGLAPLTKFIFSTDQAFNDPRITLGRVLLSELDDAAKKAILCANFESVCGRKLI